MCFVPLLFSFVELALENMVDGAKGLHNSKTTDIQAFLRFRNGLRSHSHATLWHLYSLSLIVR